MIKKIVAIGPESTGKSTLCRQLAEYYNTMWCPEYAREYLNQNGIKYEYGDLIKIAQGQLMMEDYCTEECKNLLTEKGKGVSNEKSNFLFIDTDMYVMKVWYEFVYGRCEQWVLGEIAGRKYDLYLLCNIDLPWVIDPMREYPDEKTRMQLYNMYKDLLIHQPAPWIEISGDYNTRLQTAIKSVDKFCR